MSDIVERLRRGVDTNAYQADRVMYEAADAIERLRELHHSAEKEVNELRAALRPFAVPAKCWAPTIHANDPNVPVVVFENGMRIDRGHFDMACRALEGK